MKTSHARALVGTMLFSVVALGTSVLAAAEPVQCYAVVTNDHAYPADGLYATQDEGHYRQCLSPSPTAVQQERIDRVLVAIQKREPRGAQAIIQKAGSTFFYFDTRSDYYSFFEAHGMMSGTPSETHTGICGTTHLFPQGLVSAVFDNCGYDSGPNKALTRPNPNPFATMLFELEHNLFFAMKGTSTAR